MTKLVKVETVRTRLQVADNDSVNERLELATEAATLHLESTLRTTFPRADSTDIFYIDSKQKPFMGNFVNLILAKGFVQPEDLVGPPVINALTVKISSVFSELPTADNLLAEQFILDLNKGYITLLNEPGNVFVSNPLVPSDRFFVRVDYTHGFEGSSLYKNVPSWVEEAATLIAMGIYNGEAGREFNKVNNRRAEFTGNSYGKGLALLEPYVRFRPSAYKPIG